MTRIVLASASAGRRQLLESAGVPVDVRPAGIDEHAIKRSKDWRSHVELAKMLAAEKAIAVSRLMPEATVIGADQILVCDGRRFDKPRTMDEAVEHLRYLRNRMHVLETAVACTIGGQGVWSYHAAPRLTMRAFSDGFLEDYVRRSGADLLTSAGAYKLEGLGSQLFAQVEGEYSAIVGLPLLPVLEFLRSRGALPS